jgi:LPS export ABC transporter protein LptC
MGYRYLIPFCFLIWAACDGAEKEKKQDFTEEDTTMEYVRNVEILYSDSAVVRVRVTGPVLLNFTDRDKPRQEFPNGLKIDFLEPDLSVQSVLTAKQGTRMVDKAQVTVRDSVVLNTVKKERMETEELTWDERTGKIFTEKFVKVTTPDEIIYGFGLEAEQDFSYWKITVPKGRLKVEDISN